MHSISRNECCVSSAVQLTNDRWWAVVPRCRHCFRPSSVYNSWVPPEQARVRFRVCNCYPAHKIDACLASCELATVKNSAAPSSTTMHQATCPIPVKFPVRNWNTDTSSRRSPDHRLHNPCPDLQVPQKDVAYQ